MDPVSLTLGILPLVGSAIIVYKNVRAKFRTFRHYSTEVERIRKLFGGQRDYFLNEVELVLRLVLEDQTLARDMMKDPEHAQWQAPSLTKKLEARLERNLASLEDIVEDIYKAITKIQKSFQCFVPLEEEQEKVCFRSIMPKVATLRGPVALD